MRVTTVIKAMALLTLLAGTAAAGVKYVAVVETDVDAASGASAELNSAEVREITAELRRQATENLPSGRYSVMTSETVMSMGGAVLEECAEENCVIALGSKIGADYIVRGTVSKFQTMFTLGIELYETDNGTLVVSSEAVRSENLMELLKMAATASGNMFRKFAEVKGAERESKAETEVVAKESESVTTKKRKLDYYIAPTYQTPMGTPVPWGGINVEGGLIWGNGTFLGIGVNYGGDVSSNGGLETETGGVVKGVGLSLGNVYNFNNQLQLIYGGSAGFWFEIEYDGSSRYEDFNYFAPIVKLRWKFVELTYRGLCGWRYKYNYNYDENNPSWEVAGGAGGGAYFWFDHQLMLGLYFATNKRER
jgi:hypothetical protein